MTVVVGERSSLVSPCMVTEALVQRTTHNTHTNTNTVQTFKLMMNNCCYIWVPYNNKNKMKMLTMVVTSWVTITKVMLCALLCALLLMTPTLAQSPVPPHLQCVSNFDCSLNGICQPNSVCLCDKPWSGDRCGILTYKKNQPLSSANLYPLNASDAPKSGPCVTSQGACNALNTWNGPIVQVSDTEYHMFNPL